MKNLFAFFVAVLNTVCLGIRSFCGASPLLEHYEHYSNRSTRRAKLNGNLDLAHDRATQLEHFQGSESLEAWQSDLEDLDSESLEEMEQSYEDAERRGVRGPRMKRFMRGKFGSKGSSYAGLRNAGQTPKKGRLTGGLGWVKAQFTVTIRRDSYNIPYSLPVELFNPMDVFSNTAMLRSYLPNPDVSLVSVTPDASRTNYVFLFRLISTGVTDTVTVSCNEVPYTKLLYMMITDKMNIGNGTYQISDETQTQQFKQQFYIVEQSMFGKGANNPINISSNIQPIDFRKDIVNIDLSYNLSKETGIIFGCMYIGGAPSGYSLVCSLNFNVAIAKMWK